MDVQLCLTQLLPNLPDTRTSQIDHGLPDRWKVVHVATTQGVKFTDRSQDTSSLYTTVTLTSIPEPFLGIPLPCSYPRSCR